MSCYSIPNIPDTSICTGYDRYSDTRDENNNLVIDSNVKNMAEAFNLPESFIERFRMAHYVPWTKYVAHSEKDSQVYDNFVMWTIDGPLSPEELKDLKENNPYYIQQWYDSEPVSLTTIWFKIPEGLEEKIQIFTKEENS